MNTYYFSGLYEVLSGVKRFWEEIQQYVEQNYDSDELQHVFISGDGGAWIKSATIYVYRSLYCDKYHMTKYINKAANQMLDEAELAKEKLYRYIYKNSVTGLKRIRRKCLNRQTIRIQSWTCRSMHLETGVR